MDLSPGQQLVQACHASYEAAQHFSTKVDQVPNLIACGVPDEVALLHLLDTLLNHSLMVRAFREPDRNNELTALATAPVYGAQRRLFRRLPLLTCYQPVPVIESPLT